MENYLKANELVDKIEDLYENYKNKYIYITKGDSKLKINFDKDYELTLIKSNYDYNVTYFTMDIEAILRKEDKIISQEKWFVDSDINSAWYRLVEIINKIKNN